MCSPGSIDRSILVATFKLFSLMFPFVICQASNWQVGMAVLLNITVRLTTIRLTAGLSTVYLLSTHEIIASLLASGPTDYRWLRELITAFHRTRSRYKYNAACRSNMIVQQRQRLSASIFSLSCTGPLCGNGAHRPCINSKAYLLLWPLKEKFSCIQDSSTLLTLAAFEL